MASINQDELLTRFAPRLHFDALERWRPCLADAYTAHSTFLDAAGEALDGSPPAEPAMLANLEELKSRLDPLSDGPDPDSLRRSNELLATFGEEQDLSTAGTCYGRLVHGGPGAIFLQYWLFYPDNPCVLPPGRHDGDWELVQLRLRESGAEWEATHATLAGHGKPVTRTFRSTDGGPDVFVAIDSHASYFVAGAHPMLPLSDVCTPASPAATPAVAPIPVAPDKVDWAHWHGRWGIDRGPGTWLALRLGLRRTPSFMRRLNKVGAGESPPSPGRQGASWSRPRAFQARGTQRRGTNVSIQRLAHFIGRLTWPKREPEVTVRAVAPNSYEIETSSAGHFARRVTRVSVSFMETRPDGSRRALAMQSVPAGRVAGPFEIAHDGPLTWRAAGYNRLRQRGEPIAGPGQ